MTKNKLGQILKDMYDNANDGEKVAMIHLFGMKYGNEVKKLSSFREVAQLAGIQESYSTEISKGSKISDVSANYKFNKNNTSSYNESFKIKNIILYGAPGVGKTHNYQKLITMIENGYSEKETFYSIKTNEQVELNSEEFQSIKDEKRVEFITFHQSYSYEDFIEGFRPQENGNIELEDGIFKNIAKRANDNLRDSMLQGIINIPFLELISKFTNYIQDSLDKNENFILGDKVTVESINNKGSFLLGGSIKANTQRLTIDIIERDYPLFRDGLLKTYEDIKPKFESKRTFHGNARYYFMIYKKLFEYEQSIDNTYVKLEPKEKKNYYIVIDEINRGNISKIFGELITLIEESKRDDYEVTLPYSKEKFKVPSNLYIIATMNSTDKSIATIDIALRRRFTFLKMKPNPNLVGNTEAKDLMKNLNSHICEAISEEYMLGHSYFMNINNQYDLEFVKEYKIKPLIEEYFYGDDINYSKAIEILNKQEDHQ